MKNWIFLFFVILAGCGEKKEASSVSAIPMEQQMQNNIAKHPDSLLLRETLIQYYREKGLYYEALTETGKALMHDSLNPRVYDIKAVLHFENGDTLASIAAFEKAISIYPAPEYFISLGTLYAQTGNRNALAVAETLETSDLYKAEKEGYFIRGLFYNYTNDKARAIENFDKALSISFTFMEAYREKAIALYDLGKYKESLEELDKAVKLQNNFDEGHYYRGRTLEKLGRTDEAVEAYQRALMYDPEYLEAKEALNRLQ